MLEGIYGLESVWLEHIGCKLARRKSGLRVSSRHNTSSDFNYLLLRALPAGGLTAKTVKVRQSDANRDFTAGDFSPVKFFKGQAEAGRVNLLTSGKFVGIFDLFIKKEYRGAGLGRAFLRELLRSKQRNSFFIQTWEDNSAALKLYLSLGFKIVDRYLYFSRS
ncbi:MAG: GNAT family N-acetyltransferase [Elusimicrobiales bacterium]|nr:GNAT family N-acetyltransferase [Elusimicrobiales bacterium]